MYIFLEHREKNRRRREEGEKRRRRENSILANSDGVKVGQRGLLT